MSNIISSLAWFALAIALAAVLTFVFTRRVRQGGHDHQPAASDQTSTSNKAAKANANTAQGGTSDMVQPSAALRDPLSNPLRDVAQWGYQLQDFDPVSAAQSPFDLLVIDPTIEGDDDSALTPAQITRLKQKPDGGRRIVLAYLSIGEAESYRAYWRAEWAKHKPDWLLNENPHWDENYAVRYWLQGWQDLMFGNSNAALDKIIAQGFDGVYLDKCDVYEDLERDYKSIAAARTNLAGDMIAFMTALAQYARQTRPDFAIVMQNAEGLLDDAGLCALLSGVAKEELSFGQDGGETRNQDDDFEYARHQLNLARAQGLPVFVVEYLKSKTRIKQAQEINNELGYVLTISHPNRDLAVLGASPAQALVG